VLVPVVQVGAKRSGDWMSTAAAAAYLGVTPRTLYRFIDAGDLVAYRFGRVIRLQLTDLDAFIEACRVRPGELRRSASVEGSGAL